MKPFKTESNFYFSLQSISEVFTVVSLEHLVILFHNTYAGKPPVIKLGV